MARIIDETGNQYGDLTVLYLDKDKQSSHGEKFWICQCKCGNIVSINGTSLRRNITHSCGCWRKQIHIHDKVINKVIDETGHIYGDLTVLEFAGTDSLHRALWKCKCTCGNEIIVTGHSLRQHEKVNCGCKLQRSNGALLLEHVLKDNNINFIREKTFENCRFPDTNQLARFDFYLPEYNLILEYDGLQHYVCQNTNWDTEQHLEYTKIHDNFKNQWCNQQNIRLIRIIDDHSYNNLSVKIKEILKKGNKINV